MDCIVMGWQRVGHDWGTFTFRVYLNQLIWWRSESNTWSFNPDKETYQQCLVIHSRSLNLSWSPSEMQTGLQVFAFISKWQDFHEEALRSLPNSDTSWSWFNFIFVLIVFCFFFLFLSLFFILFASLAIKAKNYCPRVCHNAHAHKKPKNAKTIRREGRTGETHSLPLIPRVEEISSLNPILNFSIRHYSNENNG